MKKIAIAACVAVAAAAFTSCGNGTPSANLKNDIDTLSYAVGMSQSDGLKEYLVQRAGIDTAYIDEFIKGINAGATAGDDKKKAAYYAGVSIGQQIGGQMVQGLNYELFGADSTQTISLKNLLAGFVSGITGKKQLMTLEQARLLADEKLRAIKASTMEKQYSDYKKKNEDFLAKNKKQQGVTTLPSGVQYKVLKAGNGAIPTDTSTVMVHYEGKTIEGKVFDSSYKRGEPVTMVCNRVIKGWTDALTHMPEGSKWEVYIPQELAYGERPQGQDIKPFSTLIFTIELIKVKPTAGNNAKAPVQGAANANVAK